MNLTLSVLAGLLLLLPGIAAVTAWNHGGHEAARRPELQLSSATAICALLAVSIVAHVAGYFLVDLVRKTTLEVYGLTGIDLGTIWPDPYLTAYEFTTQKAQTADSVKLTPDEALHSLALFIAVVFAEAVSVFVLIRNDGLDIVIGNTDLRTQGWVFQHIVQPMRHGFRPIAYVLTNITSGDRGIGYEGVVADIRQGPDGEVKVLCLAEPSRFVYELRDSKPKRWLPEPDVEIYDSQWIGGVLNLEALTIRNIVIHTIPEDDADDVVGEDGDVAVEDGDSRPLERDNVV